MSISVITSYMYAHTPTENVFRFFKGCLAHVVELEVDVRLPVCLARLTASYCHVINEWRHQTTWNIICLVAIRLGNVRGE